MVCRIRALQMWCRIEVGLLPFMLYKTSSSLHTLFKYILVQLARANTLRQTQNDQHYPEDIFKCILLNENIWIWNTISLICFLRVHLTMIQHWFRWWLGTKQATGHYLNKYWPRLIMHICVIQLQRVNAFAVSVYLYSWWHCMKIFRILFKCLLDGVINMFVL